MGKELNEKEKLGVSILKDIDFIRDKIEEKKITLLTKKHENFKMSKKTEKYFDDNNALYFFSWKGLKFKRL